MRAYWIFSLPRSGSSVTAYAAAHALGWPVADEPLGPWDRTVEPYNYPASQAELVKAHLAGQCMLEDPATIELATRVLGEIADGSEAIVVKHPHLRPPPAQFWRAFPEHRAVWLARNPLTRLNSLYARGWTDALRPNFELDHYKAFASHWSESSAPLTFEQFRANPSRFFTRLFKAWGLSKDKARVTRAVEYCEGHYHGSSKELEDRAPSSAPSEQSRSLPEEAVRMYLADPQISKLMRRNRWPRRASAYLAAG
ncbi:MAG: hypothetical protein RIE77_10205 [Phycisphaerales bacterium]|jgi:hypothetical protein